MTSDNIEDPYRRHAEHYLDRLDDMRSMISPESTDEEFDKALDEFCKHGPQILAAIEHLREEDESTPNHNRDVPEDIPLCTQDAVELEEFRKSRIYRACRAVAAFGAFVITYLLIYPLAFAIGAVVGLLVLAPWSLMCDIINCVRWSARASTRVGLFMSRTLWKGMSRIARRA